MARHCDDGTLAAFFHQAFDAAFVIGFDGEIEDVNAAAEALTGYRRDQLVGQPLALILPSDIAERHDEYIAAYRARGSGSTVLGRPRRFTISDADGVHIPILLKAFALTGGGNPSRFGAMMTGIREETLRNAEQEAQVERLAKLALTDELTGLGNRRAFLEAVEREHAHTQRGGRGSTLVIGDIDHFKEINDRFGHPAGDQTLREVAKTIMENVRKDDLVGRLGGEEFGLLLYGYDLDQAELAIARLASQLRKAPPPLAGLAAPVTLSFGVAPLSSDRSINDALQAADAALYAAKAAGRDRYIVAAPAPAERVSA